MNVLSLMLQFTIRLRMIGAIAVVLVLLGVLGGAGMFGMSRIQQLSQEFMTQSATRTAKLSELRMELARVRQFEKDMIIQYEKPEVVKQFNGRWLGSLQEADKVVVALVEGLSEEDATLARQVQAKLKSYRDLFSGVVRQLESGGYGIGHHGQPHERARRRRIRRGAGCHGAAGDGAGARPPSRRWPSRKR